MVQPLSALAYFNHINAIKPITEGLSSQCYQVNADNNFFFAKQISNTNEAYISLHAASRHLSPQVFYHDQHWLITQYINGENLALSNNTTNDKIVIAIKLMAQCHQIVEKPIELEPKIIAHELIGNTHFSLPQRTELLRVANQLTSELTRSKDSVCCHGDLNFSNILIAPMDTAYLVDFECTVAAPAEYDLAMFIAVNNIEKNKIPSIIELYKKHALVEVKLSLFNQYLLFCYLINGLWYMQIHINTNTLKFKDFAKKQWQNIHTLDEKIIF